MLKTILVLLGLSLSFSVNALTLITDAGQLTGARNVVVNGIDFDVDFIDGTCVELFSGCDSNEDFFFQTFQPAIQASTALNHQVFVGEYDDNTAAIRGCEDAQRCDIYTPYISLNPSRFAHIRAQQFSPGFDLVASNHATGSATFDFTLAPAATYAIWSLSGAVPPPPPPPSVPVPAAFWLFAPALGFVVRRRRKA